MAANDPLHDGEREARSLRGPALAPPPTVRGLSAARDSPQVSRLLEMLTAFGAPLPRARRQRYRAQLTDVLRSASEADVDWALSRMNTTDFGWGYHPSNPLARSVSYIMGDSSLELGSALSGGRHLRAVEGRPLVLLANHLSYADAHLVQFLLYAAGHVDVAERLTVVAGPKVFDDRVRRFTCTSFGTITTPQSQTCASGAAAMAPREMARLARKSISDAFERLGAGDVLLIFPEGTRARDRCLQPLLPAIIRYLEHADTVVMPLGLMGTQGVMPMGDDRLHLAHVEARLGPACDVGELRNSCDGNNRHVATALGQAIARTLEPAYRGVYAD